MPFGDWLSIVLICARLAVLPLVLVALIVATVLAVAGRPRRSARQHDPTPWLRPDKASLPAGALEVEAELRAVLAQLEELAARHRVGFELAAQPGLTVRTDPRVFRETVNHLLVHAISQAPSGRVLLGAFQHGGRVHVAVTDDGRGAERAIQEAALRPAERLAALQGATLEIDPRIGQGTILTLRLPASSTALRAVPAIDPTSVWDPERPTDSATAATR